MVLVENWNTTAEQREDARPDSRPDRKKQHGMESPGDEVAQARPSGLRRQHERRNQQDDRLPVQAADGEDRVEPARPPLQQHGQTQREERYRREVLRHEHTAEQDVVGGHGHQDDETVPGRVAIRPIRVCGNSADQPSEGEQHRHHGQGGKHVVDGDDAGGRQDERQTPGRQMHQYPRLHEPGSLEEEPLLEQGQRMPARKRQEDRGEQDGNGGVDCGDAPADPHLPAHLMTIPPFSQNTPRPSGSGGASRTTRSRIHSPGRRNAI